MNPPENYLKEEMYKEIDLIQSCINRMARNSFLIKGWSVTLMVLFLGLGSEEGAGHHLLFIPVILMFWGLDSCYLDVERKYRQKYKWIIENRPKGNSEHLFNLSPELSDKQLENGDAVVKSRRYGVLKVAMSKTIWPLYVASIIIIILAAVFSHI